MILCSGLCRSIYENGFTFDIGGHIIWSKDNEIMKFFLYFFITQNLLNSSLIFLSSFLIDVAYIRKFKIKHYYSFIMLLISKLT